MKTITYNPDTHRLVPVEPNNTALDWVDPGFGTRKEAWERILASFPQPEPVEVEPVAYYTDQGGWPRICLAVDGNHDGYETPLYTAPPDYEEIKRQRDELAKALGTQAAQDVIAERHRQQAVEGWTPKHDDLHKNGELPRAAGLYAISAGFATKYLDGETKTCPVPDGWPWANEWWKPSNARRDLVKAAALIMAEIERIDRAALASVKGGAE